MAPGLAMLLVNCAGRTCGGAAGPRTAGFVWCGRSAAARSWLHSQRPVGPRLGRQVERTQARPLASGALSPFQGLCEPLARPECLQGLQDLKLC